MADEPECIHVRSKGGKMRQYIEHALRVLVPGDGGETGRGRAVRLIGQGDCVYRAISVAEVVKRQVSELREDVCLCAAADADSKRGGLPTAEIRIELRASAGSMRTAADSSAAKAKRPSGVEPAIKQQLWHPKRRLHCQPNEK